MKIREIFPVDFLMMDENNDVDFDEDDSIELSENIHHPSGLLLSDDGKTLLLSKKLSGHVDIPEGVEIIGKNAFENCNKITSIHLPDSVKEIGFSAFFKCTSLESITIPESVERIYNAAFLGCTSLKSIHLPKSLKTANVM